MTLLNVITLNHIKSDYAYLIGILETICMWANNFGQKNVWLKKYNGTMKI